jgi:hypothetical protein
MKIIHEPVKVVPLPLIGEDERGASYEVRTDRRGDFMLAYRKKGTSSGRHYHTGKSPNKDPEILYLLTGEAVIRWRRLDASQVEEVIVRAPARVEIATYIWHELVPLSDCSFWEMNSLDDVREDSVRVEPQ